MRIIFTDKQKESLKGVICRGLRKELPLERAEAERLADSIIADLWPRENSL